MSRIHQLMVDGLWFMVLAVSLPTTNYQLPTATLKGVA